MSRIGQEFRLKRWENFYKRKFLYKSMSNVTELSNEKEFDEFVKKGHVLVDFFADWCMPCVMMSPIIDEVAENLDGKVKFAKINIDENNKLAQKFKVFSIPNFVLFKDGEVKERFVGAMPAEDFEERIRENL